MLPKNTYYSFLKIYFIQIWITKIGLIMSWKCFQSCLYAIEMVISLVFIEKKDSLREKKGESW